MAYKRKKQSLPTPGSNNFSSRVKELLELREGVRTNNQDAFVTFGELSKSVGNVLSSQTNESNVVTVGDGNPPNPPTNLVSSSNFYGNNLSWTASSSPDVWYYEVWVSNTQNRSDANQLATVAHPNNSYTHSIGADNITDDHYYWVRAIDWSGLYSTWEPSDDQGGYYVPGQTSYSEMTSDILEILQDQVTEGQLYQDLNDRIDLIDKPEVGLWSRVQAENTGLIAKFNSTDYLLDNLAESLLAEIPKLDRDYNRLAKEKKITDATIDINKDTGEITLLAQADVVTDVEARLDSVEFDLSAANSQISANVESIDIHENEIQSNTSSIEVLEDEVALKASSSYVDTKTEELKQEYQGDEVEDLKDNLPDALLWLLLGEDDQRRGQLSNKSRLATAEFNISTLSNELEAEADARLELVALVDNNVSALSEESTARANADITLANNIQELYALTGDNEALIQSNQTAIATEESARASADNTLWAEIGSSDDDPDGDTVYAAINEEASVRASKIDGVEAKYTVKVDANGHVAGYGLIATSNDGEVTSQFGVNVDTFFIASPDGSSTKIPFIVGNVGGVSTVGINGQLAVDGSIYADAIGADQIKAMHLDANEAFVNTIQSSNYSAGSEGWILDHANKLAEFNNDTEIKVTGNDKYCSLTAGDIDFYRYIDGAYRRTKSLKRVEAGVADNNTFVTVPGYWGSLPKIVTSPNNLTTFDINQSDYTQQLKCSYKDLSISNGVVSFKPKAELLIEGGTVTEDHYKIHVEGYSVTSTSLSDTSYTLSTTDTTSADIIAVTSTVDIDLFVTSEGGGVIWNASVYLRIDGIDYKIKDYDGNVLGSAYFYDEDDSFQFGVDGLSAGTHDIQIKFTFSSDGNPLYDYYCRWGRPLIEYDASSLTQAATGTVNWIAIGA